YSVNDPARVSELLRWDRPAKRLGACLVIPFRTPAGEPDGYARLKPDRPRTKAGKPVKYEAPRGTPLGRAYFPPGTVGALADPAAPLILVEGEKKAAKADQEGLPCVGLSGVWGWQRKRPAGKDGKKSGPRLLIEDLAAVAWKGRAVTVVFDSDLAD